MARSSGSRRPGRGRGDRRIARAVRRWMAVSLPCSSSMCAHPLQAAAPSSHGWMGPISLHRLLGPFAPAAAPRAAAAAGAGLLREEAARYGPCEGAGRKENLLRARGDRGWRRGLARTCSTPSRPGLRRARRGRREAVSRGGSGCREEGGGVRGRRGRVGAAEGQRRQIWKRNADAANG